MTETELKFLIPAKALAAVEKAVATASAQRTRLQAHYLDTPERHLAEAGIALRLRKEGRRWVQTLKVGGGVVRGEHNAPATVPAGSEPQADLARHAGTPLEGPLAAALNGAPPLAVRYRTDIVRRHRVLRTGGATVELAFDRGEIATTAPDGSVRRSPVAELEMELVGGSPAGLLALARRWVARHGLWLDTATKAERGDRLARGDERLRVAKARPVKLARGASVAEAWAAVLGNVLDHALPNASAIASGGDEIEHVHQLRVALRRLRSAQKLFEGWPGAPEPHWDAAARELFATLGAARDIDALNEGLVPEIRAALGPAPAPAAADPALALPASQATAPGTALRAPATTLMWLELLEALLVPAPDGADSASAKARASGAEAATEASTASKDGVPTSAEGPTGSAMPSRAANPSARRPASAAVRTGVGATLALSAATRSLDNVPADDEPAAQALKAPAIEKLAAKRLRRWHRQVRDDAKRFDSLDDDARHRLRKRMKRLRYAIEFTASLYPRKRVEAYLKRLRAAQEQLGHFNDVAVATEQYRRQLDSEPRAWFALGWLAERRRVVIGDCVTSLEAFRRAEPFWD